MSSNNMELSEIKNDLYSLIKRKSGTKKKVWEPFMRKYGCQVICEIGVFRGENFQYMIQHNPKVAVAIDSWFDDGLTYGGFPEKYNNFTQKELDEQYEDFKNGIGNKPFVQIYRERSHDAVHHFPDAYFDFIYIDADHAYEGCLQDIRDWYPKVKKGRFLLGDDYRNAIFRGLKFGVIEAVNEFAKENNLEPFELPRFTWAIIKP